MTISAATQTPPCKDLQKLVQTSELTKSKMLATRYDMQRELRSAVIAHNIKGNSHRACSCTVKSLNHFHKSGNFDDVGIKVTKEGASIQSVMHCNNGFYCPICAPSVLGEKSDEIKRVIEGALEKGMHCVMLTQTMSHKKTDKLQSLIDVLLAASKTVKSGSYRNKMKKQYGFFSSIRSLENTFSQKNGWHPHLHELYFFDRALTPADLFELKKDMSARYQQALEKKGYSANYLRGLNFSYVVKVEGEEKVRNTLDAVDYDANAKIQSSKNAALYVSKLDKELTFEFMKKARSNDSLSIFGLLEALIKEKDPKQKNIMQSRVNDFVCAVGGRARIYIPKALKEIAIDEPEKEDSETDESKNTTILRFTDRQYYTLVNMGILGRIMCVAAECPHDDLSELVIELNRYIEYEPRYI